LIFSPSPYGRGDKNACRIKSTDPANKMAIVILGNRPHSPVVKPAVNPNVFVSGLLPPATYGGIVDQIYGALK